MKRVIDGDCLCTLEYFEEKDAEAVADKYREDSRWMDVSFDCDGDLILFKEA